MGELTAIKTFGPLAKELASKRKANEDAINAVIRLDSTVELGAERPETRSGTDTTKLGTQ